MRLLKVIVMSVSFLCLTSAADPANAEQRKLAGKAARQALIKSLADEFLLEKAQNPGREHVATSGHSRLRGQRSSFANHDDCHPHSPSDCIKATCDRLGVFGCDGQDEVLAVARACQGNPDAGCVTAVCDLLGVFGCDSLSEASAVATACKASSGGCVAEACRRTGVFGCDGRDEATAVATACQHNSDESCVATVCDRLGVFGCDNLNEVLAVARSCGGN
jgi:hypothetical protein